MQSRIINCANYAPTAISLLDLISSAGGIVGTLGYGSSIQNCLNVGDSVNSIPPGGNLAGGIESTEKTDVNIENCYWFANAHNGICVVSNIENATVKDVAAFSRGLTLSKPVVVSGEAKTNVIDALNSMKNYEFEKWMVLDLNGGEMWNEGTSFYKIPVFRNKAIFVEPKKNNSIFDGWYKDNEFKTKVNPATDDIAFVDVLYAKWVFFVNVTLTYEAKKVVMIIRNDVEINYPNVDSRGFKVEWCTLDRVVCNPKTADESIELYLVQTLESFTLSFNTTIGNINIEPKMITFGEDIGELPVPEKDGLMFLGWYTDLELKQPFYEKKMPWYNLTLYAKWRDTASEEKVFSWLVTLACIAVSVGASVVVFTKREIIGINI